jgi:hypothetical protein
MGAAQLRPLDTGYKAAEEIQGQNFSGFQVMAAA